MSAMAGWLLSSDISAQLNSLRSFAVVFIQFSFTLKRERRSNVSFCINAGHEAEKREELKNVAETGWIMMMR